MARYIDADKLSADLDVVARHTREERQYYAANILKWVVQEIKNAPTADVVPRSEVNNMLTGEANSLRVKFLIAEQEVRGKALVAEHDRQLAREIFEEVNLIFRNHYEKCSEKSDLKLLEPIRQGERFVINEMWHDLAELKKKYTEGE